MTKCICFRAPSYINRALCSYALGLLRLLLYGPLLMVELTSLRIDEGVLPNHLLLLSPLIYHRRPKPVHCTKISDSPQGFIISLDTDACISLDCGDRVSEVLHEGFDNLVGRTALRRRGAWFSVFGSQHGYVGSPLPRPFFFAHFNDLCTEPIVSENAWEEAKARVSRVTGHTTA